MVEGEKMRKIIYAALIVCILASTPLLVAPASSDGYEFRNGDIVLWLMTAKSLHMYWADHADKLDQSVYPHTYWGVTFNNSREWDLYWVRIYDQVIAQYTANVIIAPSNSTAPPTNFQTTTNVHIAVANGWGVISGSGTSSDPYVYGVEK